MKKTTIATVIAGAAGIALAWGGIVYAQDTLGNHPEPMPTITAVQIAEPIETGLTLTASAASVIEGTAVTFTALADPIVAGTVEFFDGETSLGSGIIALDGTSLSTTLPVGSHSVTAHFTPSNTVAYAEVVSAAVTVEVTAAPVVVVPEEPVYEEPIDTCPPPYVLYGDRCGSAVCQVLEDGTEVPCVGAGDGRIEDNRA